jgi:DNA-directed RNA polymerase specialized sigma24 family protein
MESADPPDQQLILDEAPQESPVVTLFLFLYANFHHLIAARAYRLLPLDDAEDVINTFWLKLWKYLQEGGKFEDKGERAAKNWLMQRFQWTVTDFWRKVQRSRRLPTVSLELGIEDADGEIVELSELFAADDSEELAELLIRERVMEVAEKCLRNRKHLHLLKCRLWGYPYPEEWSQSWRDTAWTRDICPKIKAAFNEWRQHR